MFTPLPGNVSLVLELHAWTTTAVVISVVVLAVLAKADPTKLKTALLARHMVATIGFLDRRLAFWTLPKSIDMFT